MDTKKNNIIDQFVKEKLEFFEADFQPGSWELFEKKLDAEGLDASATSNPIDDAVYNKIKGFEMPFDASNWAKMDFRLDQEFIFSAAIVRYKLIELCLILVAFLFIQPFSKTPEPVNSRIYVDNEIPENPNADQSSRTAILDNNVNEDQVIGNKNLGTSLDAENLADQTISLVKDYLVFDENAKNLNDRDDIEGLNKSPFKFLEISFPSLPYLKNNLKSTDIIDSDHKELIALLDNPDVGLLDVPLSTASLLSKVKLPGKKPFLRFSMFGSPELLQIITPAHVFGGDKVESGKNYAYGYSGGFTAGFGKGKFEIETGLIYSSKSYDPLPVLFFNGSVDEGYYGEGYKRVEFNIVGVPLQFKYSFLKKGKWTAYSAAGITGQLVMVSNYFQADQEAFASAGFHPPPVNQSGSRYTSLDFIKTEKGILEGGSVFRNTFISGNIGLGIERYMSPNWSVFVQPQYSRSLIYLNGGLGPYDDKIHTYSILTGVRIKVF